MLKYLIIGDAKSVHLVKWVRELTGYYQVFVISSREVHSEIIRMLGQERCHSLNLKISHRGGNIQILFRYRAIKNLIKKINPDIVNAHYITSHGFLAALIRRFSKFRFKLVLSAWGSDILVTPHRNKVYYAITRFSLNQADLVTSDSHYMTSVIGSVSPVETMTFTFGLDELPVIDLQQKNSNLYYSNRILARNYNIRTVIDLFREILSSNANARLIISNDGDDRKALETYVMECELNDQVSFLGFISSEEQNNIYQEALWYISLPISDSTSVSLLEAMAYGCIPIVSDIPVNYEWITEGVNGIFYQPGNDVLQAIQEASRKKDSIIAINRDIISKRAIFPDSIKYFAEKINAMKGK